jgi:hypothetical protein
MQSTHTTNHDMHSKDLITYIQYKTFDYSKTNKASLGNLKNSIRRTETYSTIYKITYLQTNCKTIYDVQSRDENRYIEYKAFDLSKANEVSLGCLKKSGEQTYSIKKMRSCFCKAITRYIMIRTAEMRFDMSKTILEMY